MRLSLSSLASSMGAAGFAAPPCLLIGCMASCVEVQLHSVVEAGSCAWSKEFSCRHSYQLLTLSTMCIISLPYGSAVLCVC